MKIAVLTLPLLNNYGGILQAYAMMKMLEDLGHEPILINLKSKRGLKYLIKQIIKKYCLFFMDRYKNEKIVFQNKKTKQFVEQKINPKTKEISDYRQLKKLFENRDLNVCVVGSDQVFRTLEYPDFPDVYSLNFLGNDILKVAYAVSFGGKYEGKVEKIGMYSKDLKKFKAISVREDSAVKICKDLFEVKATHVLDPTMMIDQRYYVDLLKSVKESRTKNKVFAYILDKQSDKDKIIDEFIRRKGGEVFQLNDGNGARRVLFVEQWLKYIYDAEYVVTDSFHGCVFAIIFNKPFYCFVNERRGADRFYSLLKKFNLEDRIIKKSIIQDNTINWEDVNKRLYAYKAFSRDFLTRSLKQNN